MCLTESHDDQKEANTTQEHVFYTYTSQAYNSTVYMLIHRNNTVHE